MPTLDQIRAARALLNWSQSDLAERAGLSQTGIARIESGVNQPNLQTMERIETALRLAGIDFMGDHGVDRRSNTLLTLSGQSGLRQLYDDIYMALKYEGGDFLLNNVSQKLWEDSVGIDYATTHRDRMRKLKNFKMQAILREGDSFLTISDYCEYRWAHEHLYDTVTFCLYSNKMALIIFEHTIPVTIHIIQNDVVCAAYKKQFQALWDIALVPPSNNN